MNLESRSRTLELGWKQARLSGDSAHGAEASHPLLKDQDQSRFLTHEPFPDLNMSFWSSKTPTATNNLF